MDYKGKLYGKVGNEYFPLQETSRDFDKIKNLLIELRKNFLFKVDENGDLKASISEILNLWDEVNSVL